VKVPAEEVGWGLTPGSGGLSGLPTDEKQPEVGLETADRFIHHVPWEYPHVLLSAGRELSRCCVSQPSAAAPRPRPLRCGLLITEHSVSRPRGGKG
jgi:hypothetical protein